MLSPVSLVQVTGPQVHILLLVRVLSLRPVDGLRLALYTRRWICSPSFQLVNELKADHAKVSTKNQVT